MPGYQVESLANEHCVTGECPLWHPEQNAVYWTDIPNGHLFRYFLGENRWERFYSGPEVGGFTFQADGDLLLFRVNEIVKLSPDGAETLVVNDIDSAMERFNDVTTDPEGRVFAGSIGVTNESGGLYRVDHDGTVTRLFTGTGCANGMGFTPDHKRFYWTDSTAGEIYIFDYDRATGAIANRRVFFSPDDSKGIPDGLAVDSKGFIWSARWDGYCLLRHSPSGEVEDIIEFPVAKVSSVCFGGTDLKDLYVTTAGGSDGSNSDDGTLYHVRVEVPGLPENRSQICLGSKEG